MLNERPFYFTNVSGADSFYGPGINSESNILASHPCTCLSLRGDSVSPTFVACNADRKKRYPLRPSSIGTKEKLSNLSSL